MPDRCPKWLQFFRRSMPAAFGGAGASIVILAVEGRNATFGSLLMAGVWAVWLVLGTAGRILTRG